MKGGTWLKSKIPRPGLLRTLLAVLVVWPWPRPFVYRFPPPGRYDGVPLRYKEYVEYYAGKYNIDPLILYSFIRTESNFNPNAQSNVGARPDADHRGDVRLDQAEDRPQRGSDL